MVRTILEPLSLELKDNYILVNNDLRISFRHTIRVLDDENVTSDLPPGFGKFSLQPISDVAAHLPHDMTAKGGIFFPMHQSEAMWINFSCHRPHQTYMVKIYVGGINAISGEPANENAGTDLRRREKAAGNSSRGSLQDYIVIPGQRWLDGIVSADGLVRQFFATEFGIGHSVEHQITGQDEVGGIQFEVTPYKESKFPVDTSIELTIIKLTGTSVVLDMYIDDTVDAVKAKIQDYEGIPPHQQRLLFQGRHLQDNYKLSECGITGDCTMNLALGLRGGGSGPPPKEVSMAAGGKIKQVIYPDIKPPAHWRSHKTTVFNVQVFNPELYEMITHLDAHPQQMSIQQYHAQGGPFYNVHESPSGIHGDFNAVKSVGRITGGKEQILRPRTVNIGNGDSRGYVVGLVNPQGPLRDFRTLRDLENGLKHLSLRSGKQY